MESPLLSNIGSFIPGVPIPTPILIVIAFAIIVSLVLRFTNLGLYTQAVGINEKSARLNGINAVGMKFLSFMMLGVCVSIAGCIGVSRMGLINHETLLLDIEMDAILAVAIGGNALSGGKFSITGSVIGAYIIQSADHYALCDEGFLPRRSRRIRRSSSSPSSCSALRWCSGI